MSKAQDISGNSKQALSTAEIMHFSPTVLELATFVTTSRHLVHFFPCSRGYEIFLEDGQVPETASTYRAHATTLRQNLELKL